jgi:hypothetical protein
MFTKNLKVLYKKYHFITRRQSLNRLFDKQIEPSRREKSTGFPRYSATFGHFGNLEFADKKSIFDKKKSLGTIFADVKKRIRR